MTNPPPITEIETPQFCPWCGAPSGYRPAPHLPLWERLAEERHRPAPAVVKDALATDAYMTGCAGCRRVSHVIGHPAAPAS